MGTVRKASQVLLSPASRGCRNREVKPWARAKRQGGLQTWRTSEQPQKPISAATSQTTPRSAGAPPAPPPQQRPSPRRPHPFSELPGWAGTRGGPGTPPPRVTAPHPPPRGRQQACGAGAGGQTPAGGGRAWLQRLTRTLLQPPDPPPHPPRSGGGSTHLSPQGCGHPPSSRNCLPGATPRGRREPRGGHTLSGEGDTPRPSPSPTATRQPSAELLARPPRPASPAETQNHLFLSFPFSSWGGLQPSDPSREPFTGDAAAPATC